LQIIERYAKNNFLNLSATEKFQTLEKTKKKRNEKSRWKKQRKSLKYAHYFEFIGINYSN
jgi:hypothetical protein